MEWGNCFFLALLLLLVLLCCSPLKIEGYAEYQAHWSGRITVWMWGFHRHWQWPTANQAEQEKKINQQKKAAVKQTVWQRLEKQDRRFQAEWDAIFTFLPKAIRQISKAGSLEQLLLEFCVGFSQPDRTAYSYALFWAVLSLLPPEWMRHVSAAYWPDFEQARKELHLQGIICTSIGQLIVMMTGLLWLVLKLRQEQNRREQIAYEN